MMLRFEGVRDFQVAPDDLWVKLRDARFLVQCVPGAVGIASQDQDRAVCTLRPGFAFVHGSLELTMEVADVNPGREAAVKLHSKGIGTTSDIEARLKLEAHESGTRLAWSAEIVQLGGLLKAIPQGLVKASAQKVIEDALIAVEKKLHDS
jgi:carbon monoxide dehydrogenase subunit G